MKENRLTQEERLLAAFAHGSVIAIGFGFIVGIVIYLTQKEKSAYAAGQALQAAIYQLAGLFLMGIAWGCWTGFYFLTLIPLITNADQYADAPPPIFWVGIISMVCPFIFMAAWCLYGLYGALRAWMGAEFRYAVIGRLVESRD